MEVVRVVVMGIEEGSALQKKVSAVCTRGEVLEFGQGLLQGCEYSTPSQLLWGLSGQRWGFTEVGLYTFGALQRRGLHRGGIASQCCLTVLLLAAPFGFHPATTAGVLHSVSHLNPWIDVNCKLPRWSETGMPF